MMKIKTNNGHAEIIPVSAGGLQWFHAFLYDEKGKPLGEEGLDTTIPCTFGQLRREAEKLIKIKKYFCY